MFSPILPIKKLFRLSLIALTAFSATFSAVSEVRAEVIVEKNNSLGIIKGIVRDNDGKPIVDAYVSIFRVGTSNLLKQVRSAEDGSFLARIIPGTYTVLAVAEGFNPITVSAVEVNRSAELSYKFKLERSGNGNTLPEKRIDRKSSKWRIQAAQMSRSIYQNKEGDAPIDEIEAAKTTDEEGTDLSDLEKDGKRESGQNIVESYFANSNGENYTGLNFARFQQLGKNAEIIFAGQIGSSRFSPQTFQTNFKFIPQEKHQIRINGAIGELGKVRNGDKNQSLGQFSLQVSDEWNIREGVIFVYGLDYSKFIGAGNDFSVSPRFGLQYDLNSKTRFRTAYTTQTEEKSWQRAIELEDSQILFREAVSVQDFVIEHDKPRMNKSRRLEFGVERILDNKSTIEANAFVDTTFNRGVGLTNFSFDELAADENFGDFVGNQQGRAQGVRVVYTRRLNGTFSTSAGYAFGNGQRLSDKAISSPGSFFENDFFQTIVGQFNADLKTGTQVKTIFRLSPQATIFAIDPFQGRLAIYDPSLSIMVTQSLPNLGLPLRAEAIVDARNLFDFQTNTSNEEGGLQLNSQRRTLRGGILVRF